jgi:hypothetical protein
MRPALTPSVVTDASKAAIEAAAAEHEPRCRRAVERLLRRLVREAVAAFEDSTRIVHAAAEADWTPPSYHVPVSSDLLDEEAANELLGETTSKHAGAAARSVAGDLAVQFDVSSRLLEGVIASQAGQKIVTAPSDLVETMMGSLQTSYDEGHSIPRAAREMRKAGYAQSQRMAERIARTEVISASNAASLASVRAGTDLKYKSWMATNDALTRPEHAEADGQVVKIEATFDVGGEALDCPGDGSAWNAINCRCSIGYQDEPGVAVLANRASRVPLDTGGTSMATAEAEQTDAPVGAAWSGVIAQEGVDTGDGRRIERNALGWRALPLTLMGQTTTPEWGGHTDAQVCGRIDSITREGDDILAGGVFDTGTVGADIERMVREQVLRGVSVDLAVNEAEMIPDEEIEDPMEAWFMGTFVILDGTILGATVVPFPAFENASIAIVAGGAMRIGNRRFENIDGKRTLVVSFFMPFGAEFADPPPPPAGEKKPADGEDDPDQGEDDAVETAMTAVENAVDKLRSAIDADAASEPK